MPALSPCRLPTQQGRSHESPSATGSGGTSGGHSERRNRRIHSGGGRSRDWGRRRIPVRAGWEATPGRSFGGRPRRAGARGAGSEGEGRRCAMAELPDGRPDCHPNFRGRRPGLRCGRRRAGHGSHGGGRGRRRGGEAAPAGRQSTASCTRSAGDEPRGGGRPAAAGKGREVDWVRRPRALGRRKKRREGDN